MKRRRSFQEMLNESAELCDACYAGAMMVTVPFFGDFR